METEWATRTMGSMGAGVISPDDVVATIWARITHKCLLISEHTASPITLLLLSREAQPPLLVAIPLQTIGKGQTRPSESINASDRCHAELSRDSHQPHFRVS